MLGYDNLHYRIYMGFIHIRETHQLGFQMVHRWAQEKARHVQQLEPFGAFHGQRPHGKNGTYNRNRALPVV